MTRSIALAALASISLACGPLGPIPGGRLSGEVVNSPMEDWSFASDVETIELETLPDDPYSVSVWFVSQGSRLWVASGGGDKSKWAQNLSSDPRARLRIDGKLYERRAVRAEEHAEQDEVLVLFQTKYASVPHSPVAKDEDKVVVFRMEPR
jgi:hypothetical protein